MNQRGWVIFTLACLVWLSGAMPAEAWYSNKPYLPMGLSEQKHVSHRTLFFASKININSASLEELKTLPGVNEEVALKIIRMRPFRSLDDLYKLPSLSSAYIYQLIERMKNRVTLGNTI